MAIFGLLIRNNRQTLRANITRSCSSWQNTRPAFAGEVTDPIICLVGGMGPLASAQIHCSLVNAVSRIDGVDFDDQYPDIVHVSPSRGLYDVSPWMMQNQGAINDPKTPNAQIPRNPGVYCADVVREMVFPFAAAAGRRVIVGCCCNTFHAKSTFVPFLERLRAPLHHPLHGPLDVDVHVRAEGFGVDFEERTAGSDCGRGRRSIECSVMNMPLQTVAGLPPSVERVGVLCSEATRDLGIYRDACQTDKRVYVSHPPEMQEAVTAGIYATKKYGTCIPEDVTEAMLDVARHLRDVGGAQAVILGCTEIPVVLPVETAAVEGILAVDAGEMMVEHLIREWRA